MGAGSSAEQRSPQDGATAAEESQPGSPAGEAPTAAAAGAEPEQPEDPAKLLQKNGQISIINGITEEQVELSLKPEELKKEQGEAVITDVGQRETANVILKEEPAENMETKPAESPGKSNIDVEQKDAEDADQQLPSEEEKVEEQAEPSESPSANDVGFKKVFKFVGFKFTVRKEKTEKAEPVQLLNVKADEIEVLSEGAGDCKEIRLDTVEEETQSEVPYPVEKAEQETQTEQTKEEISPEKVTESPVEAGSKETEIKSDGSKSPESPTSPLTNETASPLRKFFTQGWTGFRKRTSFRKPKEEQQATEREMQEQEKRVIKEEATPTEESEKEKPIPEKEKAEVSIEASDAIVEREETKMIDVSTETHKEEAVAAFEQPSPQMSAESVDIEPSKSLNKIDLEENLEPAQKCQMALEHSPLASSEKKSELAAPLATEVFEEKTDQSAPTSPMPIETPEEHFEIVEAISELKAPLATENFDDRPTEICTDVSTTVEKKEPKPTEKSKLVLEQFVETDVEIKGQTTDEQLKVKESLVELVNEPLKQTEPSSGDSATIKPLEVITNEVELLSSQERAKIQGSPLKKLFTSSSLKKLSAKKHKGKREEAKLGEAAEQAQQLSDSAESPEDPRAESSASSPEETTESVGKVTDAAQTTETEDGSTSDMERKRDIVTPWASFKKMVTPKKRVRRLSESDKEEELEKAKTATLSSTESASCEEQDDIKENAEEQKLEKSIDEPKRKVDTSVSWEALICVGSSKKRTRKSSTSDEEVGQRLAQEGQKIDENGPNKETAPSMTITSSQESDHGQGGFSPEQAGSPSEGEGVSTWESFKRLVTPRRKSKTKMEERNEESSTAPSLEHYTSDGESGKEESWVSFKKLMPGRRKKKSDGIPEHAPVQEAGEEMTEIHEDDSDIPAVVPLSEYDAAEQEKFEAQKAKQDDLTKKTSDQSESTLIIEQSNEGLVHAVTVTMVEGERAVTSIEERSPSWISAAVTESIERAKEDEEKHIDQISETGIVEEMVVVTKVMPEIQKEISGDTLTSEAITAREETSGVEETAEVSCAEETTEMVSAVSRLTESPDTTEIVTPVQEVEESQQNLEELNKQTQEILQEVAERVKLSSEAQETILPEKIEKTGQETTIIFQEAEPPSKEEPEKTDIQVSESSQSQDEAKESSSKEALEKSNDICVEVKESSKETVSLDKTDESHDSKIEQEIVQEIIEKQTAEEEGFVIITVTPEEGPEVNVGDLVKEAETNLKDAVEGGIIDTGRAVDELAKISHEEKRQFSQKLEQVVNTIPDLEAKLVTAADEVKAPVQKEIKEAEPPCAEVFVLEAPIQSKITEVPVQNAVTEVSDLGMAKHATLGLLPGSTENVVVEACIQNKDTEVSVVTETHVQKVEPKGQLQKPETNISMVNEKLEPLHAETVEEDLPTRKVEVEVHKQNAETETHKQSVETDGHVKEVEMKFLEERVEAEKAELKEDLELPTKAEAVSPSEKEVEEHIKETEAQISTEKAHAKLEAVPCTEKVDVKADVEKVEVEISKTQMEVQTSTDKGESEAPSEIMKVEDPIEKTKAAAEESNASVCVEAITVKPDVKVEAEVPAEKAETVASSDQPDEKLDMETPAEEVDIESAVEIAKEKSQVKVPAKKLGAEDSAKKAKVTSSVEKAEGDIILKEKTEAPIEKAVIKAGVEVFAEKEDAKVEVKSPSEKVHKEVFSEQSEEIVEAETTATKQPEVKEILKNVENEVNSLATSVEIIYDKASVISDKTEAPGQREMQDVSLSLELKCFDAVVTEELSKNEVKDDSPLVKTSTEQAVAERSVERGLVEVSTPDQNAVDAIQKDVTDASHTLKLEGAEGIAVDVPKSNELKDVTLVTATEGSVQNEKEDALIVGSKHTEAELTEDSTVKSEATVDLVKKEVENRELTTEAKFTGIVATEAVKTKVGDTLISDSGALSDVISEKKESSVTEGSEAGINGVCVQSEVCPRKLPLETVLPLPQSATVSDSSERRQALSEKVLVTETEKSTGKIELAGADALCAAPVQQEMFTEQQEVITTDIPEAQSFGVHKSSVTVTAATAEEQVVAENVTVMETLTENLQSLLEEPKETTFKTVQQVSFVQPGLAALGPDKDTVSWSGKANSVVEEVVLAAVTCTKDDLIQKSVLDSSPEMKLQRLESSQEGGKKTPPERSPSLTHIEFQKDVVQSVTIESQSTKIVLKIIQNAVDTLEQTEELPSVSKQQSEPFLKGVNKSEIQESLQTGQILPVKGRGEKDLEIQPSAIILTQSAENQEAFKVAEEMPFASDKSEDAKVKLMLQPDERSGAVTTLAQDPQSLNEIVKEIKQETDFQKENGEPKLHSAGDTATPTEIQRPAVEDTASGDLPKESLEVAQPRLMDVEAGQTVQIQQQFIEQQTPMKNKDDQSQSTGFVETYTEKDVNNQDYTISESPQLSLELTES
ncbi:A-kinase anchor protein 12 isoform X2 [Podarcis raffonei]|uniref:A-kinase anchor protein 12 isoform X2 n=1 Tax=Podarcis raffonei TaxID=65483 RepID=UPI0023293A6D|nr:A-kinase anchor protein 12 isoform X2 [Podarcis raffonei]